MQWAGAYLAGDIDANLAEDRPQCMVSLLVSETGLELGNPLHKCGCLIEILNAIRPAALDLR